jgi:hypothetical protein
MKAERKIFVVESSCVQQKPTTGNQQQAVGYAREE